MQVFNFLQRVTLKKPTFILGGFETIHHGHQRLIEIAQTNAPGDVVLVLIKNIAAVPRKNRVVIEQLPFRLQKLAFLKLDYALVLTYNTAIQNLAPQRFIDQLVATYHVQQFVVGSDYRFGKNALWGAQELQNYFPATKIVKPLKVKNAKISTSLIKEQISFGKIAFANTLLVRDWSVNVQIVFQNKVEWDQAIIRPHAGCYAIHFLHNNWQYYGVVLFPLLGPITVRLIDVGSLDLQNWHGTIVFKKMLHYVIKAEETKIRNEDVKAAKDYFLNATL